MQSHVDRTNAETASIRAGVEKAKRALEGLASLETPQDPIAPQTAIKRDANGDIDMDGDARAPETKSRPEHIWSELDEDTDD